MDGTDKAVSAIFRQVGLEDMNVSAVGHRDPRKLPNLSSPSKCRHPRPGAGRLADALSRLTSQLTRIALDEYEAQP